MCVWAVSRNAEVRCLLLLYWWEPTVGEEGVFLFTSQTQCLKTCRTTWASLLYLISWMNACPWQNSVLLYDLNVSFNAFAIEAHVCCTAALFLSPLCVKAWWGCSNPKTKNIQHHQKWTILPIHFKQKECPNPLTGASLRPQREEMAARYQWIAEMFIIHKMSLM